MYSYIYIYTAPVYTLFSGPGQVKGGGGMIVDRRPLQTSTTIVTVHIIKIH